MNYHETVIQFLNGYSIYNRTMQKKTYEKKLVAVLCKKLSRFCTNLVLLPLLLTISANTYSAEAATPLKPVSFMPLWSPQAQFAGYYVALEKGIYAKYGLNLRILKAGPAISPADALKNGEADFALLWLTTALDERSRGAQFKNIAQFIQKSSLMLIAKKSSGIHAIAEMNGKKVGLWGGDLSIPAIALLNERNVKVREIRQSYTVNLFLRDGIDVTSAMWYNEFHTLLNSGINPDELNTFFMSKYGMNFPEDGIYALEKTVKKDPLLAQAFVAASLEGWRYAFEHPEEAVDITVNYMRKAGLPANKNHQTWMLNRMRDLSHPVKGVEFGALDKNAYEFVVRKMQQDRLIATPIDYHQFSWKPNAEKF
jgi:NitT/TauT family transport system substrate-binding protein